MGFLDFLKKLIGKGKEPDETYNIENTSITVKVHGGASPPSKPSSASKPSPTSQAAKPSAASKSSKPITPKSTPAKRRGTPKTFATKVAGVSHEGRQKWVAMCRVGQEVVLQRERTNQYDADAIGVWVNVGGGMKQVGYIREGVNIDLAKKMDNGWQVKAKVKDRTGLEAGKTKGLVIEVSVNPNG